MREVGRDHGLTLVDDPQLTDRAREERVCVELCPVSNYQTNRFRDERKGGAGRKYPLRTLLDNGNAVCINTDNPIISHTNIITEYFQASYAFGEPGLSLWEALRIIRMGFVHSFMSLPERRAMLELVDQIIFDLFSSQAVVDTLRSLVRPTGRR
jgi:adenosine deaminase